jgi:3-phosphoshikimate 1-carboxyvinyltransferase
MAPVNMNPDKELWSAPFAPSVPLNASLSIPGSKSMMARALIRAALSNAPTLIKRPLVSRDSELMRDGLRVLGVGIEESSELWRITPAHLMPVGRSTERSDKEGSSALEGSRSKEIDVGNAGTVMRFLPPVAALSHGEFRFDGDARSHERPLAPMIKALESLGVRIDHDGRYALPMTVYGSGRVQGGEIEIDASLSSQFISSLLLAAPAMIDGLIIKDIGPTLPSIPHIEMTIAALEQDGVNVESGVESGVERKSEGGKRWWKVSPHSAGDEVRTIEIEPDLSNAAPFLAAALLVGGRVAIENWPRATRQPGDALREILTAMGGRLTREGADIVIQASGKRSDIKGIDIDLSDEGELAPTIAAIAAFASSPSHLRGIGHLRLHETDRVSALATELRKVGAIVIEGADQLQITPAPAEIETPPREAVTIASYDDHRIATLGALVGLMLPGTLVENIATTRKTITDFPALWSQLLGMERAK